MRIFSSHVKIRASSHPHLPRAAETQSTAASSSNLCILKHSILNLLCVAQLQLPGNSGPLVTGHYDMTTRRRWSRAGLVKRVPDFFEYDLSHNSMCDIYQKYFLFLRCEGSLRGDNKVMLIMSIGELANLPKQKREVEQKTNKLLILCVELILLFYFFQQRKLLLAGVYQHLVTAFCVVCRSRTISSHQ